LQGGQREKVVRTLVRICTRTGQLPRSYLLSTPALEKLGTTPVAYGGFSDVWCGKYGDQRVALKVFRLSESDDTSITRKAFIREVIHWKSIRHRNVIPLLGIDNTLFQFCMVSPWCHYGNIAQYLKERPDEKRLDLLIDVASGLQYLHSMEMVHGDLKSANILIDNEKRACLADFGITGLIYNLTMPRTTSTTYNGKGTTRWIAPELLDPDRLGANDEC